MDAVATASPNIYTLDLVSFGRGVLDRGLVFPDARVGNISVPVDTFEILRIDDSIVHKSAGDIKVVDRSHLHPGQVVGSASDVGGQIGIITDVTTVLDLVDFDKSGMATKVIKGVSPSSLWRVRRLSLGDFVVSGPWLGRVVEVSIDVDVMFDDGAVCRVTDAESKTLTRVGDAMDGNHMYRQQENSRFYPGLRVSAPDPCSLFKATLWLNGYWNPNRIVGTIIKVKTSTALVYWIASMHCGTDKGLIDASAPPAYQNADDLTFFSAASHCCWGVADACFFREPSSTKIDDANGDAACAHDQDAGGKEEEGEDVIGDECEAPTAHVLPSTKEMDVRFYQKQLRKVFFEGHRRARRPQVRRHAEVKFPMVVARTHTSVDVLWQDGTRQHGRRSTTVIPFGIVNEHEFFPGEQVVDAAGDQSGMASTIVNNHIVDDGTRSTKRVGVVRSMHSKDQTVRVSWFKAAVCPDEAREVECDDMVSTYDLKRDSGHSAYYGDIVIRLLPSRSPNDSTAPLRGNTDLSWVGRVIDIPSGYVQVKWGDGNISMVLPNEILVVREEYYMDLWTEMGHWVEDDGVDDAPEEPGAANMDDGLRNPANDSDVEGDNEPAKSTSLLGFAFQSLLQLTGDLVARGKGYLVNRLPIPSSSPSRELSTATKDDSIGAAAMETSNAAVARNVVELNGDGHDFAEGTKDAYGTSCCNKSLGFPRFDVLQIAPPDHHYLDTTDEGGSRGKNWAKTVQKEWKILENDLPEIIYVRAFEDRMDLLRLVMVGASGTPYSHGLFFFDLQLPPSYPAAPPQVYYHSFGLRLNPNLYESGTVCLSLLGTFDGEGTELWSPATSSLLQVVVSIHGLVLNAQPYYNEAGYETLVGKPEGHRNALPYSENAYLLTLRTMLHLLRRPPRGFEKFVKEHFHCRGRFVLRQCNMWLQGYVVGDAHATESSSEQPCSAGLRLALANVVPSLIAAFTEIGAEGCD
ncbi:probable ubiquitin-conjugating enzyme E2 23 [Aegilops tauschii subsp. strangulata]